MTRVGVQVMLKSFDKGMLSDLTRNGIRLAFKKSATLLSGYVTASICRQPIQTGLKKLSNIGFFSAFALLRASFRSVLQLTCPIRFSFRKIFFSARLSLIE